MSILNLETLTMAITEQTEITETEEEKVVKSRLGKSSFKKSFLT